MLELTLMVNAQETMPHSELSEKDNVTSHLLAASWPCFRRIPRSISSLVNKAELCAQSASL